MRDFTPEMYEKLLTCLKNNKYSFLTFYEYLKNKNHFSKIVIIKHDIDLKPNNALLTSNIEFNMKIKASYYFRASTNSFSPSVIKKLKKQGHEIGYHYEELSLTKGNVDKAYALFKKNLQIIQQITDIKTICMHGSPLSRFNNKKIWDKYNYKNLGIIGDPAFDIDFRKFFYITDTGRKWNSNAGVRDCADVSRDFNIKIINTKDLINKINQNTIPPYVMINVHSQRWHQKKYYWLKELFLQNFKNIIKLFIIQFRKWQITKY